MTSKFSYQQKIAILRILFDIVQADGQIDAREIYYFNQIKEELGLDAEARKDINDKNSLLALLQIKAFSAEQKEYLAKLMANMIVVDEDINPNEVAIYDVVREYCGLEQMFDRTIEPKQQD